MFARFDENPAMTLQDIKETKRYGWTDNVKTVYPPQTKFAGGGGGGGGGGYNEVNKIQSRFIEICMHFCTWWERVGLCYGGPSNLL